MDPHLICSLIMAACAVVNTILKVLKFRRLK
jgi:hypothetical protein